MELTPSFQTQRLNALYHLSVELSAQRDLHAVLHTALDQCLSLTDSEFGFVGLVTEDGKSMDVVATEGFFPGAQFYDRHHLIPLRPNIFSIAVIHNRPIRSANAMNDPRRVGQPDGHPPVHSFLGVPLRLQSNTIGMIGVANRPSEYEDDHEQLLATYAAQVAVVIRNAQLLEQLTQANERLEQMVDKRTAELENAKEILAEKANQLKILLDETFNVEERERQRIAQDMHDGVNQLLYGALFELKSAEARLNKGELEAATSALGVSRKILHQIESELKRIIHDLRPQVLDNLGLIPALRQHIKQIEPYASFKCTLNALGTPTPLPTNLKINIYRLVQEALQNATNHAQASYVKILLVYAPRVLKLTIDDDGVGFDWASIQRRYQDHLGLIGMRERVESLNGSLSIQSEPGQGTHIEVSLPIVGEASEEAA